MRAIIGLVVLAVALGWSVLYSEGAEKKLYDRCMESGTRFKCDIEQTARNIR